MAEGNNQPKTKISGGERFNLDTYGYAHLGMTNPDIQNPAMGEMYKTFMGEHDPLIQKTLTEAAMARQHIQTKQKYDATPEDQRGDTENPGQVNEYLVKSLEVLNQAGLMYTKKRIGMISELTCTQALDYHSGKDGKTSVELADNVVKAIKSNSSKIKELGDSDKEKYISDSLIALDTYKVEGIINSRLQKTLAEERIEMASKGLEELTNQESSQ